MGQKGFRERYYRKVLKHGPHQREGVVDRESYQGPVGGVLARGQVCRRNIIIEGARPGAGAIRGTTRLLLET